MIDQNESLGKLALILILGGSWIYVWGWCVARKFTEDDWVKGKEKISDALSIAVSIAALATFAVALAVSIAALATFAVALALSLATFAVAAFVFIFFDLTTDCNVRLFIFFGAYLAYRERMRKLSVPQETPENEEIS